MEKNVILQSGSEQLTATVHVPDSSNTRTWRQEGWPVVIICHGLVGNRIGTDRLFVKAAREFANNGFIVVRFDYAGCGESSGDYGAGGLDAMIAQTRDVLEYTMHLEQVDPERIVLLGHSLGGAVASLTASLDPRVASLILWAPVAQPFQDIVNIVGTEGYQQAITEGAVEYLGYSLSRHYFESLMENQPLQHTQAFSGNVLVLHGTDDAVISVDSCLQYEQAYRQRTTGQVEKELIHGAGHTFSSRASQESLYQATVNWLLATQDAIPN